MHTTIVCDALIGLALSVLVAANSAAVINRIVNDPPDLDPCDGRPIPCRERLRNGRTSMY